MKRLLALLLLLVSLALAAAPILEQKTPTNGDFNTAAATLTNKVISCASNTLQGLQGQCLLIDVRNYGATGNGTTDDHVAFNGAVAAVNTAWAANTPAVLYIPAGRYYLNGPITQFAARTPGYVRGDGTMQSFIVLGSSFTGSVFTWDDAWSASGAGTPTYTFGSAWVGGGIQDLTIFANTGSGAQTALTFLDHNDFFLLQNVNIWYMNGSAITIGTVNTDTSAYMRESKFYDLRVFYSGSSSAPAVHISSTTTVSSDATNELKFYGLDIFASSGVGLQIDNADAFNATRLIDFYGLRVENATGTFDLVRIGDTTNTGPVQGISIFGLEENTVPTSAVGFHVATTTNNIYSINVTSALFQTGGGKAIQVDGGRAIHISPVQIATSGTQLTVASSSSVSCCIWVEGDFPSSLTTSIDPSVAADVFVNGGTGWYVDFSGNGIFNSLTGAIGGTTADAGAFSTLSASGAVSGAGFSTYLASPPAIGGTAPAAITGTTVSVTGTSAGSGYGIYSPFAGGTGFYTAGSTPFYCSSSTCIVTGSVTLQAANISPGGKVLISSTAPTVTSGLGTSPVVTAPSTGAFEITVGSTGTPSTAVVLGMPTATDGWACVAQDTSTIVDTNHQSGYTASSVTFTFAIAPANSDKIVFNCGAF